MIDQATNQVWFDSAFNTYWVVRRVWKNSIRMVSPVTGTTMRASNRHGMTEPHWRLVGGFL